MQRAEFPAQHFRRLHNKLDKRQEKGVFPTIKWFDWLKKRRLQLLWVKTFAVVWARAVSS